MLEIDVVKELRENVVVDGEIEVVDQEEQERVEKNEKAQFLRSVKEFDENEKGDGVADYDGVATRRQQKDFLEMTNVGAENARDYDLKS